MINLQAQFYKTFARPVAKVLLTAVLTYQILYWGWVKLDTEEVRGEKAGERTSKGLLEAEQGGQQRWSAG